MIKSLPRNQLWWFSVGRESWGKIKQVVSALHQNHTKYLGRLWSTHHCLGKQLALFSMEYYPT